MRICSLAAISTERARSNAEVLAANFIGAKVDTALRENELRVADREFQELAHSPAVYTDPGSLVHAKLAEPPDPKSNPCETQGRNCTASLSSRGSITMHRERPQLEDRARWCVG